MARSTLTREEKRELLNHHITKIREADGLVIKAKAPLDAAREELTSRFNAAKSDLGSTYTRKYLAELATAVGGVTGEITQTEKQRFEDRQDLAVPVYGDQLGLFGGAATVTEEDLIAAEVDGYRAGRRADDRDVPAHFLTFSPDWLRGYDKGQAENVALMAAGKTVSEKRAKPETEKQAEADTADQTKGADFDVGAEAKRLKAAGFVPEKPKPAPAAAPRERRSATAGSELRVVS